MWWGGNHPRPTSTHPCPDPGGNCALDLFWTSSLSLLFSSVPSPSLTVVCSTERGHLSEEFCLLHYPLMRAHADTHTHTYPLSAVPFISSYCLTQPPKKPLTCKSVPFISLWRDIEWSGGVKYHWPLPSNPPSASYHLDGAVSSQ